MPRIILKKNSPEFAEPGQQTQTRCCDYPGCDKIGEHKAPKHRGLNEYYYFCVDHVREYNKAWNFFEGMSETEVQDHMLRSMYGDRPTWRYDSEGGLEDDLRDRVWQEYEGSDEAPRGGQKRQSYHTHESGHAAQEIEALALMGLEPPTDLKEIKERYKGLAKKHHPDLNPDCDKSEEMLKKINMAYTILKVAYESFEKLPKSD